MQQACGRCRRVRPIRVPAGSVVHFVWVCASHAASLPCAPAPPTPLRCCVALGAARGGQVCVTEAGRWRRLTRAYLAR